MRLRDSHQTPLNTLWYEASQLLCARALWTSLEHRRVFRPARCMVAVEVALSLLFLVVSGLFPKSFSKLATLNVGFDARNMLLVKVNLNSAKVAASQQSALREEMLARERIPSHR